MDECLCSSPDECSCLSLTNSSAPESSQLTYNLDYTTFESDYLLDELIFIESLRLHLNSDGVSTNDWHIYDGKLNNQQDTIVVIHQKSKSKTKQTMQELGEIMMPTMQVQKLVAKLMFVRSNESPKYFQSIRKRAKRFIRKHANSMEFQKQNKFSETFV